MLARLASGDLLLSIRCGALLTVVARDFQINDLSCGSSILRFGWSCKLFIGSALGAGSLHWTISAIG
jgi:hypothetical protein